MSSNTILVMLINVNNLSSACLDPPNEVVGAVTTMAKIFTF